MIPRLGPANFLTLIDGKLWTANDLNRFTLVIVSVRFTVNNGCRVEWGLHRVVEVPTQGSAWHSKYRIFSLRNPYKEF